MDQATFTAECRKQAAADLGADKLTEIIRKAYAEDAGREVRDTDYATRDAQMRRQAAASENAYNCPRGEWK